MLLQYSYIDFHLQNRGARELSRGRGRSMMSPSKYRKESRKENRKAARMQQHTDEPRSSWRDGKRLPPGESHASACDRAAEGARARRAGPSGITGDYR